VLISESLVRELWPGRSALGRTFTASAFGNAAVPPTFTVVGVVGDVRFEDLRRREHPIVYAAPRSDPGMVSFAVRTALPPVALLEPIRQAVRDIRPDVAVAFAESMESSVARETASIRFSSLLLIVAAATTLLLSVLGVYGMIAYVVGLRRPEFGVRLALGATGAQLRRMVLAQGLLTAAFGVAVGLVGAAAASRFLRSLLFGIEPVDAATYSIAAMLLLLCAAAAAGVPAARASRVDPGEALRGS
jgi:predicted lysophospholipase L1 biosynthesis ABC-type transport system permease subunit